MTQEEKAIRWFENIADECDKLTSGNVAHLKAQIKGMAIRSAEYLTKHSQGPTSEDLEQVANRYADNTTNLDARETRYRGFTTGAQWQKEQMMKNAVDAEVTGISPLVDGKVYDSEKKTKRLSAIYSVKNTSYCELGDKVKLIIFPGNN